MDPIKEAELTERLTGKYSLQSSENLDAFLKELGVGYLFRKMANVFTPTIEMRKDENGNISVKAGTWFGVLESQFKLDEEFDEKRFDGKMCKSTVHLEGDHTFIQTQNDGEREVKYIREFEKNLLKVTMDTKNIIGKYKLEISNNFDNFLKEIGVGYVKRKMANVAYPELDITKDEDGYISIKTVAPFRTQTTRFKLDEWFDEERMDGKIVKSLITLDENSNFVQIQKDGDLEIKYVREFGDNQIKVTSICKDVSCYRVYKKID